MHNISRAGFLSDIQFNFLYFTDVVDPCEKRNIRVNGDGSGIAWYMDLIDMPVCNGSCVFKLTTPAWSNANLVNMGSYIKAPVFLGHIRAASDGRNPLENVNISYENCHPFKYKR